MAVAKKILIAANENYAIFRRENVSPTAVVGLTATANKRNAAIWTVASVCYKAVHAKPVRTAPLVLYATCSPKNVNPANAPQTVIVRWGNAAISPPDYAKGLDSSAVMTVNVPVR